MLPYIFTPIFRRRFAAQPSAALASRVLSTRVVVATVPLCRSLFSDVCSTMRRRRFAGSELALKLSNSIFDFSQLQHVDELLFTLESALEPLLMLESVRRFIVVKGALGRLIVLVTRPYR
jgi:hypothetical protein